MEAKEPMMQQPYCQDGTTNVVVCQPGQQTQVRLWSSGLFSCFDDLESCVLVYFCGCCYLCHMYTRYGESCQTPCCVPMSDMALRIQHRNRFRITGTVMDDCVKATFCGACALCQLKRDMDFVESSGGRLAF